MEPVFFVVLRTDRTIRLQAATDFDWEKGTYSPMSKRHKDARPAAEIMTTFQMVARQMDPYRVDASKLVEAAEPYLRSAGLVCRLLVARGKLPSRIMVKLED